MSGFLSNMRSSVSNTKSILNTSKLLSFNDEFDSRIKYTVRNNARRISIKIDTAKREAHVTVPGKRAVGQAKAFVDEKRDWIAVQLERLPQSQPFHDGKTFLFRGQPFTLIHDGLKGIPKIDYDRSEIRVPAPDADALAGRTKRLLIRLARKDLTTATAHYAGMLERPVEKITVRDTSSRWGSCVKGSGDRGGRINYSWRLILAPDFVLDYVVAHECAHLIEANHGPKFWALVDDLMDRDVKPARAWLNKYGAQLHAVGAGY